LCAHSLITVFYQPKSVGGLETREDLMNKLHFFALVVLGLCFSGFCGNTDSNSIFKPLGGINGGIDDISYHVEAYGDSSEAQPFTFEARYRGLDGVGIKNPQGLTVRMIDLINLVNKIHFDTSPGEHHNKWNGVQVCYLVISKR
jgi:hypothetical protein